MYSLREVVPEKRYESRRQVFVEQEGRSHDQRRRSEHRKTALTLGSKRKGSQNIVPIELRKIGEYFIKARPRCEEPEDVANCDARATNNGIPRPDLRIDADSSE